LLNSLSLGDGGQLTCLANQNRLELIVLRDLTIAAGSDLAVDGKGFAGGSGTGAGGLLSGQGGGGGYGGAGGHSAVGAPGGTNYGSAVQPVDRGSGGGASGLGGSEGGGALRIRVGGTLSIAGSLSANGNAGWFDDSGGGAGGSTWITASNLAGDGVISATGGDGEFYNGGGGGGGRIALYSPANTFTGLVSVAGGAGAHAGQDGTVFVGTNLPGFQIVAHSPLGVVSNLVSAVDLTFSDAVNPNSVSPADFSLFTPAGPVAPTNLAVSAVGLFTVRVSFPVQNTPGDYRLEVGEGIEGLFAQPLAQVYTGAFTLALPTISGTVTNARGVAVSGVTLQPDGGLPAAITDANGNYSIGVPHGWNGSVAPVSGSFVFVPGTRAYANVTDSLADQDFLMVESIAPRLNFEASGTNVSLRWAGIPGVAYQIMASTNLTDWFPYGGALPGTNGLMTFVLPVMHPPLQFLRVRAAN